MRALFLSACPNCGGDIPDVRLSLGVPCEKCLPISNEEIAKISSISSSESFKFKIYKLLENYNTLNKLYSVFNIDVKLKELDELFHKATGSRLWSAQRAWARRALAGRSFAIIAPTGMGKTVFGITLSVYNAINRRRSYIIVPTAILAEQIYNKITTFIEKLNLNIKALRYHSVLDRKKRKEELNRIFNSEFDILITTSSFLTNNFNIVSKFLFDLVFVDDVDSLLKSSKNVDKVLMLLGLAPEIVSNGLKLVDLRVKLSKIQKQKKASKEIDSVKSEIECIRESISNFLKNTKTGILIVSGASTRAKRTKRVKLFNDLLGFEIGSKVEFIRNIEDIYVQDVHVIEDKVVDLIRKLGSGGIIFIPVDKGMEYAEKLYRKLIENGISAGIYTKSKRKLIENFTNGKYDVLVGIASYRSPLARGIDIPHRIRYAIFAGVPKFRISLDIQEEFKPSRALILLANLRELLEQKEQDLVDKYIMDLRNLMSIVKGDDIKRIVNAIKQNTELTGFLERVRERISEIISFLTNLIEREDVKEKIKSAPYLSISSELGKPYLIVPDAVAYIQASGRTSRLYLGGVSKGISIVIIDDEKAFNGLMRETKWYVEEINWKNIKDVNIAEMLKAVDNDRAAIRKLMDGVVSPEFRDIVKTALLVVESPTKAKTIAKFFGKPSRRTIHGLTVYEVSTGDLVLNIAASGGHIFDIPTHDLGGNSLHGVLSIDGRFIPAYITIKRCLTCKKTFTEPIDKCLFCRFPLEDKMRIIEALRDIALETDMVLIGTDVDSEGEKIGWDVAQMLMLYTPMIKRIEFHEVTKRALINALKNMRDINHKLVEAQIVRRVEDRWIGFELSKKLWSKFNNYRLSAGRVQTPVLGWIVERTTEARKNIQEFFELTLENGVKIVLKKPLMKHDEVKKEIDKLKNLTCTVKEDIRENVEVNPPPPFSTDSLLNESAATLKFSVNKIMALAQDLFEVGLITYHRTDSIRVSSIGQNIAWEYIKDKFGEEFFKPREWSREGAHECIRPTRPIDSARLRQLLALGIIRLAKRLTDEHLALYDIIFKRFIASQMTPTKVMRQKCEIVIEDHVERIEGYIHIIKPGFSLIRPLHLMPEIKKGIIKVINVQNWKAPTINLLTQGDIVGLMKSKGIGRPSTYAKIMETLFQRGYVKESPKRNIISTKKGYMVYMYLSHEFSEFVSEETTRRLEEIMDLIEKGNIDYQNVLHKLHSEIINIRAR
jgi:reverse gyrase